MSREARPEWHLAGWCELRNDFRTFRLDRLVSLTVKDETFANEPGKRLKDYFIRFEKDS